MRRAHFSESLPSFPRFCAYVCELQPGVSAEEAQEKLGRKLTAILVRQLKLSGCWEPNDLTDCGTDLLMFIEKKLREPLEFDVAAVAADRGRVPVLERTAMHLLRPESFAITVGHAEFRSSQRFGVQLRNLADGSDIISFPDLSCGESKSASIRLAYDALRHEQDVLLELIPEGEGRIAFYARVLPVRHESFQVRMGFVAKSARYIACAHLRAARKGRAVLPLEDLPPAQHPGRLDPRQDIAWLTAKREIERLPKELLAELLQRQGSTLSWAEIARLREASEVTLRKGDSRTFQRLIKAFFAGQSGVTRGMMRGAVKWLKDMLPQILEGE
jgi:hypothetical protein